MATKPETSSTQFLPEVFQTEPNRQVLSSSLDVLTSQPDFIRVEGFIGNKYGYAVEPTDRYIVEPTKTRSDYQLTPGLVFLKKDTQTVRDFIDYPGIIDALKNSKSSTSNPNKLFESEFYSWDSFTNIDMVVNYTQYYWLPLGPDAVVITGSVNIGDVVGEKNYTSSNGIKFINGLKVVFESIVDATNTYTSGVEYYVEGVGTSITLIRVSDLLVSETTSEGVYYPWDDKPWDETSWDIQLYVPVTPDYILVNRASRDRNAWSRCNRWFSQNVIDTVTQVNGQVTTNESNTMTRASRPIIQFEGNLSLWNSGDISAGFVNYIDNSTTDPLSTIVGQATCNVTVTMGTKTVTVNAIEGSRVIFTNAADTTTRKTVYVVNYVPAGIGGALVVALTPAPGVNIINGSQVYIVSGPDKQEDGKFVIRMSGTAWRWNESQTTWEESQQKTRINQPPLFDIFDIDGQSLSLQPQSTFAGTKLFSYTPGTGPNDPVLGFPISYSSVSNIGDINFDINLNSDTYTTGVGATLATKQVSDGFVHYSPLLGTIVKRTGWVNAVAPSVQYQVFTSVVTEDNQLTVDCDILIADNTTWAPIQVYLDGTFVDSDQYVVITDTDYNTTSVIFNEPLLAGQGVSILLISDQTSPTAYYSIPDNLQNNPFNTNITQASVGDIRGHYSSIFINAPGLTGEQFGTNNFNDLGDLTPYGTSIIQNSASLALPMTFLRRPDYDINAALQYNSAEYADYKNTIIDVAYSEDYSVYQSPADILDSVIYKITSAKSPDESFFWSDMMPSGSPYASNTYNFGTSVSQTICPLGRVYNFESANYYGVLVYLIRTVNKRVTYTQLVKGIDYVVSTTEPSLTVNYNILAGDKIQVKEYNQTYGSYIPNTPTKLGLYGATVPKVYTDDTYTQPTKFIVGHDGSYNKLYGDYIGGQLNDFRDIALLEFETRVYNNLKWKGEIPLQYVDLFPGEFRSTGFTRSELMPLYSQNFLNWAGSNRIDYKTQVYSKDNKFTYNYNKSGDKLQGIALNATTPIQQGYWRGIYLWFYDTTNPADAPWEMLGFTDKPTWWTTQYGPAPYLPTNAMWLDLRDGLVRGPNYPLGSYIEPTRVRPQLMSVLPVDDLGNLRVPFDSVVSSFDPLTFNRGWVVGDVGPAEASYLKSSQWPFDLMKMLAAFRPAKFYNLFADRDLYKYNADLNQYLFNDRYHLEPRELTIYGNGTSKNSYINWIVDYINQTGTDGGTSVTTTLQNIDVRLTYRLAGFSDKQYLKFLIERSTPTSNTPRLLIPDDSYDILLYDNVPSDNIEYSSVIIQRTNLGWTVWGNSLNNAYFTVTDPTPGPLEQITVNGTTVQISSTYRANSRTTVAYGTEFYSLQGVSEFLRNYGRCQSELGVLFDNIKEGVEVDWTLMIKEFIAWATQGWEIGSTISVNPNATLFNVLRPGLVVQPMSTATGSFVLNQNLIPLQQQNMAVIRNNEAFSIKVLSVGDAVAYTNLNLSSIEHAIVFNNTTTFNDTIYQLTTGLRQNRLIMSGNKTAGWTGYINANGFVMNEGDIQEWNIAGKYPKGQIVIYKDNYWSANELIEPQQTFDYIQWTQIDYEKVKVGLLPNPTTQAYEAAKFYNIYDSNLERDQDLLAFGLVGFRPRQYMVDAELSDITQVNVYLNMIPQKGTNLIANAFKNAQLVQGKIDYDVRENWAIKNGDFGGVMNNNFVEVALSQQLLTGNPSIIGFSSRGVTPTQTNETVDIANFINYGRAPSSANFLPPFTGDYRSERGLPTAGYVNIADAKFTAYEFEDLNLEPGSVATLFTTDYVWIANYRGSWAILQPQTVNTTVTTITNNLDGTVTVLFAGPHGLVANDPFLIADFDTLINGYFIVKSVASLNSVVVTSDLSKSTARLTGQGIAMKLVSRRFAQASDATVIPGTQFATHLSWVDDMGNGEWEVLAAGTTYDASKDTTFVAPSLGVGVAYTNTIGYLSIDGAGKLYRDNVHLTTLPAGVSTLTSAAQLIAVGNHAYCSDPTGGRVFHYELVGPTLTLVETIIEPTTGAITVSSDLNWLYVADTTSATIKVFMKSAATGLYGNIPVATLSGPAAQSFGASITTSIDGSKLIVGAPTKPETIGGILEANVGIAYIYARGSQTFMMPATLDIGDATVNSALVYVNSVIDTGATITAGVVTLSSTPAAGSIVTVDWGTLTLQEILQSEAPHDEARFGNSVSTNRYGAEIMVGVPYELDNATNTEGAVYRYTNSGQLYGTVTATPTLPVVGAKTIYIDGYKIVIPDGITTTAQIAAIIEASEPTNVTASSTTTTVVISTIPGTTNTPYDIIDIVGATSADLAALGIKVYGTGPSQIIRNPDGGVYTSFGWTVAMNRETSSARDSVVISAPTGTILSATTFDNIDNLIDDDTIFDNGATSFNDSFQQAGSAYQFDYLPSALPSATNPGQYVFGQYCVVPNDADQSTLGRSGFTDYGSALAFNDGVIAIGSPKWYTDSRGRVDGFTANTETSSWYTYRQPSQQVDINLVNNISIYNTETNSDLDYLDYIDPVQGKMLSAVETNIDFISQTDPAGYTTGVVWGEAQVGKTWLDTTNLRMMNYSQANSTGVADNLYNSAYWGVAFPGSTADVFTWVVSNTAPINYVGLGFVVNLDNYTSSVILDRQSDTLVDRYYFWVKNYTGLPQGKTLSPSVLTQYILNPVASGVSFLAPLTTNVVALYNCGSSVQSNSSALHIGYGTNANGDTLHQDWSLVQVDTADSFLVGVPSSISGSPSGMYLKYLNSFMGGEVVNNNFLSLPDTSLPVLVRYGTQFRPRQTMFVDRQSAIKNYIDYSNSILSKFPVTETRGTYLLEQSGTTPVPYNVRNYWTETDWWAEGYSSSTKVIVEVQSYTDLLTLGNSRLFSDVSSEGLLLTLTQGLIARVIDNGQGQSETYVYDTITGWNRIGLENGTIQLNTTLYTDTTTAASMAVYWTIRWLTEQVYTNDLEIENNNLLIMMFNLIQSQSIQQNNYLPWLNKTSLVDISNVIRSLLPYKKFQRDNQGLVEGYINEVKPFHVYIKSYTLKYTAFDNYTMTMSDFDLPAKFNSDEGTYISPQLIYSGASEGSQYLPTSAIWSEPEYTSWFNHYGLSVSNSEVQYLPVTKLVQNNLITTTTLALVPGDTTIQLANVTGIASSGMLIINGNEFPYSNVNYVTGTMTLHITISQDYPVSTPITVLTPILSPSDYTLQVQNSDSLPNSGVILIDDELIYYNQIDRTNSVLTGIIRGFQNTAPAEHSAVSEVYLQTSPVMVVAPGRGYTDVPSITAIIDTVETVQAWVSGTTYGIGEKVIYNNAGWVCIRYNSSVTFNGIYWNQIEIYPVPRTSAQFTAVITNGGLTSVTVNNAGDGYAAMPTMIVEPSPITATWSATAMDTVTNQIYIQNHPFLTGDSVVFQSVIENLTQLTPGAYYWVNKIDVDTIALYYNYEDAIAGWSTQSPADSQILAVSGTVLTMFNSDFTTGSRVKLSLTTGEFNYYWVGRDSVDPSQSTKISLFNTLEDALANTNRVVSGAAPGDILSNIQMTDNTRVVFDVSIGGTLNVAAIVRSYTNEQPVREMKVTIKFDRTSYTYDPLDNNAIARIENFYKPTTSMLGFKTDDYTQLMTGTSYDGVNLTGLPFSYGDTDSYDSVVDSTGNNEPYEVSGGSFEQGYSPEELMAGLITDTVNITVASRPGATWTPDEPAVGLQNSSVMAHTGFNMNRFTATPTAVRLQDGTTVLNAIDFSHQVANPVSMAIYADASIYLPGSTPGSQRRVTNDQFVIDWVNQIIEVLNPLIQTTPIDIVLYEFGNGKQLIRSNSTIYALQTADSPVPHTEILLDVPYQNSPGIEGISLPNDSNYWETVVVFVNGERVLYNDVLLPTPPGYTLPKFTVQPQRTLDPINDPYNPAKLVFDGLFDSSTDYISFVVSNDNIGVSVPETQWFTNKSGTGVTLDLTGFIGDDNLSPNNDNIIVEINGLRYADISPLVLDYTASSQILAYQIPVYSINSYSQSYLTVKVNGVTVLPSTTTWQDNFDSLTGQPASLDSDFGLLYGYFDDGVPFDTKTMLAVVFKDGYLTDGDNIELLYSPAGSTTAFSVTPNSNKIGGQLLLSVPVVASDIISVTTFNRTTQQSLVTVTIQDATVSIISAVVETAGLPVQVTTAQPHNLSTGDTVAINGNAAPDLDGGVFFVMYVSSTTVTLWQNSNLTIPVTFVNANPLLPSTFTSYIQAVDSVLFDLDQPLYELYNSNRLWVSVITSGGSPTRNYLSPDKFLILNNSLVLLQRINSTDVILVTSTVSSASPNATRFRINMDKYAGYSSGWNAISWDFTGWSIDDISKFGSVYRENQQTRTYTKSTMITSTQNDNQMIVDNPYRLVNIVYQTGLTVDSSGNLIIQNIQVNILSSIIVRLQGTDTVISDFTVQAINGTSVKLTFGSLTSAQVDVDIALGNQLMIQSEQIKFSYINLFTGVISGLERGLNGTIVNPILYSGSEVVAVLESEQLDSAYYQIEWYENYTGADIDYPTNTIPLQLSSTAPSDFLNTVV